MIRPDPALIRVELERDWPSVPVRTVECDHLKRVVIVRLPDGYGRPSNAVASAIRRLVPMTYAVDIVSRGAG